MENDNESTDFSDRQPEREPLVERVLREHGLAVDASLEEIAHVASNLWVSMPKRAQVVEMMLGRRVGGEELVADHELGRIILLDDPDEAIERLYALKTLETVERSASEQGDDDEQDGTGQSGQP